MDVCFIKVKKILLLFLFIVTFSCMKSEITQHWYERKNAAIDAQGLQYYFLDGSRLSYCGGGLGRKFCRFLDKYDGTIWEDVENYYSDFSDIKFEFHGPVFISFFNIDNQVSYCKGWKRDENIYDGIKWNITFKSAEEDVLWFDFDYYGTSQEIEYTITYKYEVIDGLLHFSNSEDQSFIFHPSDKNYSRELIDTDEIIELEGCIFF